MWGYIMPGGRPPKFKSVEYLQGLIDVYFASLVDEDGKRIAPATITGLALALDMSTRDTLLDYEKNNPNFKEFSDAIKKAKLRCQNYAENFLFSGQNATGAIFNLKNNYGWKDKREHEIGLNVDLSDKLRRAFEREGGGNG